MEVGFKEESSRRNRGQYEYGALSKQQTGEGEYKKREGEYKKREGEVLWS